MGYVDRSRTEFGSWEDYQNSSVVRLNVSGSDFFLHDQCQYGVYIYNYIIYIYISWVFRSVFPRVVFHDIPSHKSTRCKRCILHHGSTWYTSPISFDATCVGICIKSNKQHENKHPKHWLLHLRQETNHLINGQNKGQSNGIHLSPPTSKPLGPMDNRGYPYAPWAPCMESVRKVMEHWCVNH
jgi:hypothetical protein